MDRDPNYVVVGAFVVLVIFMASSFVYWYTGQRERHHYERYEIYFHGSVSGLSRGSPVRYLGVDVGRVVVMRIDPLQPKDVEVIVDIESYAPIDGRTQASLNMQGITGVLYVDLEQDPKYTATELPKGRQYPVIRSAPSEFDVLLASLPALATHAIDLVDRMNRVLSDDNVRRLTATLDEVHQASEQLPAMLHQVQLLVADLRHTSQEVEGAATDVRTLVHSETPTIQASLANVQRLSENLADTAQRLDRFVTDNEPQFTRFARQTLPEIDQLMRESQQAVRDFHDLSRKLEQNPSQILYEPNRHGVELPQ